MQCITLVALVFYTPRLTPTLPQTFLFGTPLQKTRAPPPPLFKRLFFFESYSFPPAPVFTRPAATDELRFGSSTTMGPHPTYYWRHFSCITPTQITNAVTEYGSLEAIPGVKETGCIAKLTVAVRGEGGKPNGHLLHSRAHMHAHAHTHTSAKHLLSSSATNTD